MKHLCCRRMAVFILLILCAMAASTAGAQSYHNVVNRRFATIGDGPQSALILDVKDASDTTAVRQAALQQYQALLQSRRPALLQELDFMRRHHLVKPEAQFDFSAAILVRQNGRLPILERNKGTRGPGPSGNLTFNVPTTGTGAWSATSQAQITALINLLYPEIKAIMGPPLWSGTVNVLNLDPTLGKVSEPLGSVLIVSQANGQLNVEIDFPTFSSFETNFLAMAQVMAQAFHGPYRIGYDAWELGMARAVAVIAARNMQGTLPGTVNPANGFYYTPDYDLLNQPPLANNTFLPPTKSNQPFNPATLSGMLVPRLQMASTAWVKVYIENPTFFQAFNAGYYNLLATEPGQNIPNNIPVLVSLAASIVPNVELQPFNVWYQHQYVLDTSITPGPKLYAYAQPTFPDTTTNPPTPAGAAIFLVYYQTTLTGDEQDLSGTVYPIYWDYTFTNRLNFQSGTSVIPISNGFGSVAPLFQNLGGSSDMMRVTMDFPINNEYVRLYFPADETGTDAQPTDFSGVVVGADSGTLSVSFSGGGTVKTTVAQGVFGAASPGSVPSGFSKTTLQFTAQGIQPITFQRNTAFNDTPPYNISPIFQLVVPAQVVTLSHTFPAGPQMVSLPLKPLNPDLAGELGLTLSQSLLAQWREDTQIQPNNPDQYMRYPSMPLYQPGYSFWSNLATTITNNNLLGENMDVQQDVSVALNYGWNQIGPPYNTTVNVATDLAFTYQGTLYPTLADAQNTSNNIIAPGIFTFSPSSGYVDITSSAQTSFPVNTLQPWQGYWIRVLVPEGVTLTYSTASSRAAKRGLRGKATRVASSRSAAPDPYGWRVPLTLRDESGHATSAVIGQSSRGAEAFVPSLDEASPPPFPGAQAPAIRFPHSDWNTGFGNGGDFLADIRRANTKAQWDMVVTVPAPNASYTLSWNGTATLPRNTRLTLVDTETGARQMMNSASSYTFQSGSTLTHHFQIVAEPRLASHLFIRNVEVLAPHSTGGRAVRSITIAYELTADAEANIEILQAGHVIRHLVTGRAVTAGVNQMLWDLKDDRGVGLASGPYMVSITARTPDGEQTRQVVPMLLTR